MDAKQIVESVPTSVLLRDAEAFSKQSPADRGFNVSKALRQGAMVCLASTIPLFVLRTHERQMSYPLYSQTEEHSMEPQKFPAAHATPTLDMSTLQDAVSGLGFLLDPPSAFSPEGSPLPASQFAQIPPPSGLNPQSTHLGF